MTAPRDDDTPALVRDLRRRLGLTQEQLAQRAGVTYSTVNHWENGRRRPQPFLRRRLREMRAEAFGQASPRPQRSPAPRAPRRSKVERMVDEMVQRIVARFNPQQVILFGSRARGTATPTSDVDLLVVMPVSRSTRDTAVEIGVALHDIAVPKDIVVTTPEEFAWRTDIVGTIERVAARDGVVLYARS